MPPYLHHKEDDKYDDAANKAKQTHEQTLGSSLAIDPPISTPLLGILKGNVQKDYSGDLNTGLVTFIGICGIFKWGFDWFLGPV